MGIIQFLLLVDILRIKRKLLAKSSKMPVGIDIIEIHRVEQAILSWQNSFLRRIYTEAELDNCHNVPQSLAVRFAAKEAVMKALGIGIRGLNWQDIEILSDTNGVPSVQLYGRARSKAREVGINDFSVTMSHSKEYAVAFVIGDVS